MTRSRERLRRPRTRVAALGVLAVVATLVGCAGTLPAYPVPAAVADPPVAAGETTPARPPIPDPVVTLDHETLDIARRTGRPETPPQPSSAPPAASEPPLPAFAMDLYEVGDFVGQYTFEWCVAASIQMAYNMATPETRTARDDQQRLWEIARDRSSNPYRGADPGGWATVLNEIGIGPYELVSVPEYDDALRVAARAMRDTGRPVGLVMWRGRHAWVMNGFESVGDPSRNDDFQVTGVRVLDPLYPHGSSIWGASPPPNTLMTPDELATQFVFRERKRWSSHVEPGFLLVVPIASDPEAFDPFAREARAIP